MRLPTRERFHSRSTSKDWRECRQTDGAREYLRGTPLSSLRVGGGGGPERSLVELEGGVLKEPISYFFEDSPGTTPGKAEADLFPLDSLEERVPLGE
ncbi:UNVERIFIED_CONTAM: hypothetical protein Slati_2727000 [Sesamum latifolium]|uniref:Uncharacterized protein n=1 Tax=Sesamum latifolium TaxID=2727402 RepID=A0AAW2VX00_9LAMI